MKYPPAKEKNCLAKIKVTYIDNILYENINCDLHDESHLIYNEII